MSEVIERPTAEQPRTVQPLPVDAVKLSGQTYTEKSFRVNLPEGIVPSWWKHVQGSPMALAEFANVRVIDWAQSFVVDCIVSAANDKVSSFRNQ